MAQAVFLCVESLLFVLSMSFYEDAFVVGEGWAFGMHPTR